MVIVYLYVRRINSSINSLINFLVQQINVAEVEISVEIEQ